MTKWKLSGSASWGSLGGQSALVLVFDGLQQPLTPTESPACYQGHVWGSNNFLSSPLPKRSRPWGKAELTW